VLHDRQNGVLSEEFYREVRIIRFSQTLKRQKLYLNAGRTGSLHLALLSMLQGQGGRAGCLCSANSVW
jgi:hypothetical protein